MDVEDIVPRSLVIDEALNFEQLIPSQKNQDNLFTHAPKEKVYQYLLDLISHPQLSDHAEGKTLVQIKREKFLQ